MFTQAIVTKYLGPTDRHGSRIKATAWAGTLTMPYNHALCSDDNHAAAALLLQRKLGWETPERGTLAGGSLPDGTGYAFVFVTARDILPECLSEDTRAFVAEKDGRFADVDAALTCFHAAVKTAKGG